VAGRFDRGGFRKEVVMHSELVLRGAIFGFALAAPIGPIGVLVIRRSLVDGAVAGLASGLGAAAADAIFALAAAFGIVELGQLPDGPNALLRMGGGAVLVALGVRGLAARAESESQSASASASESESASASASTRALSHARAFATTLALTMASPISILTFAGMAATFGISAARADALVLVGGVFLGSASWWLILSSAVASLRRRLPPSAMRWCNRLSAATLVVFGALAMAS
jgi:threonine/homoserine/homoserine lactone efflux protein